MLEIVEEMIFVILFLGEDEQRVLFECVVKFLLKICSNYILIDIKDYLVEGISEKYCGCVLFFLLMYVVIQCIDVYVEQMNCYLLEICCYYCQFDYQD